MSKEQLEQMEHDYKNAFPINIEWLLEYAKEQTERVDDMMRLVRYHKEKQKEAENENEPYRHQNKRYREALKQIEENYKTSKGAVSDEVLAYTSKEIARKSLEGESE